MLDHLCEQWCAGKDGEAFPGFLGDGVRYDDLLELRLAHPFDRRAREDRVHRRGVDILVRPALHESILRGDEGARRVDHVVEDHARPSLDVANHIEYFHLLMGRTALVEDGQRSSEHVGELLGVLGRADIRGDHRDVLELAFGNGFAQQVVSAQRINGDGEESLDLLGVEVEGHHVVCTRFFQEVRDELR